MHVRWSPDAANDFERIVTYVHGDNPPAARRIADRVYQSVVGLMAFPMRGCPGRVRATRELPLTPLPFIVVYRVLDDVIEIVRVLHGAQRWP